MTHRRSEGAAEAAGVPVRWGTWRGMALGALALGAACVAKEPSEAEGDPELPTPAARLRQVFPAAAGAILDDGRPPVEEAGALVLRAPSAGPAALELRVPRAAPGVVRLVTPSGLAMAIHEESVDGEGAIVDGAVTYGRRGGRSFWASVPGGVEEWIHLRAGTAFGGAPCAAWEISGATLRQRGAEVDVVDADGVTQVRVSAPAAVAAGGRAVDVRLTARGARLELEADAGGDEVLVDPQWASATPLLAARYGHTATLLPAGRVLVLGGEQFGATPQGPDFAQIFTLGTGAWTPAASLAPRYSHTATWLANGKVIALGGALPGGGAYATATQYDPMLDTWTSLPPMSVGRSGHTATRLPDGRILVLAGYGQGAEVYDPVTRIWTTLPSMAVPRRLHTATLLPDGRVLVVGGLLSATTPAAELYDPAAATWAATGPMTALRASHTATLLPDGTVLVAGGTNNYVSLPSAEIFHPATATWTPTGSMLTGRGSATATLLPGGKVLVTGGEINVFTATNLAELYDPASGTWTAAAPLAGARSDHTATLLDDGKVFVVGGTTSGVINAVATVEVYSPACAVAADCGAGACVDGFCCDTPCAGLCEACSAAKKGGGADGVCGPVASGQDPDGECAAQAPSSCGTTGACDGMRACQRFAAGTVCAAATCAGGTQVAAGLCDGAGTCVAGAGQGCGLYACGAAACLSTCTTDAQCAAGAYCAGGTCLPALPLGAPCTKPSQCASGSCADGVCCDAACDGGPCEACSKLAGAAADGVCEQLTGAPCDDGDVCTLVDTCVAGVCTGGAPVDCAALDACHDPGACDPVAGCSYPPKPDGAPCDDGSLCTATDVCQAGACVGTAPVTCPPAGACEEQVACDPATGHCLTVPAPDGAACDDGDPCTWSDACAAGACAGVPAACPAPAPCHEPGACDPGTGACASAPVPDGTPCAGGSCLAGACEPGGDAGLPPGGDDPGGCACALPGRGTAPSAPAWGAAAVLLGAWVARRRRRALAWAAWIAGALSQGCSAEPPATVTEPPATGVAAEALHWVEQARLLSSDIGQNDELGGSVAVEGDTALVGARSHTGTKTQTGATYVFVRGPSGWTQQQALAAPDAATNQMFGHAVAVSGDTALVGAYGDSLYRGAAYVFVRSNGAWSFQQKLTAPDAAPFDDLGYSVALSGDTAVVGAWLDTVGATTKAGSAYVFVRSGGAWSLQQKLTSPAPAAEQHFGYAAALSGDTLAVGAFNYAGPTSAYVFTRAGATWNAGQQLFASDGVPGDGFGTGVAVSADAVVVGAPQRDFQGTGAAYVFAASNGVWAQQQKLEASDGKPGDDFGHAVAVEGNGLVVGAWTASSSIPYLGAAYVFARSAGAWSEQARLQPLIGHDLAGFGAAAGISGDQIVVGAPFDNSGSWFQGGAAYAFALRKDTGDPCAAGAECATGACIDGVCCESTCGPCGVCSAAAGSTADGVCAPAPAGKPCRAPAGACDAVEVCDGVTAICPPDHLAKAGTVCRPAAGGCDVAEVCSGASATCPPDALAAAGTLCRPAAGLCDVAEACTGSSASCPADALAALGTVCRAPTGPCDVAEVCVGLADCPADVVAPAGIACRPSAGPCDVAEACDGQGKACPADALRPAGHVCRAAIGDCDAAEACTGGDADCPADAPLPAGTTCRAAAGACDAAEACDGQGKTCPPDLVAPSGTICRAAAGACDVAETCDGAAVTCPADGVRAAGTPCRQAASACDVAETCDGTAAACPPDAPADDGAPCPGGTCGGGTCVADVPDAGPADAGAPPGDPDQPGGCGCRVGGPPAAPGGGGLALGLAVVAWIRRRRGAGGR